LEFGQATAGVLPRLGAALAAEFLRALVLAGAFNVMGSNSFLMGSLAGAQLWLCLVAPALALAELPGRRPWDGVAEARITGKTRQVLGQK
jgi:hypothetical protein